MRRHPGFGIPTATPVLRAALERKGGGAPEGAHQEAASADAAAPSESSASLYERHLLRKTRRGLASRRSTAALATPIKAMAQSRPCFLGRAAAGVTCRDAVPVQRGTPRAGHNAGRSDARTAREQGYEPCPQEPHPPPSIGRHRLTSLRRTDRMQVSIAVTNVKALVPAIETIIFPHCRSVSRMRCSTQWCTARPGSSRSRRPHSEPVKVPGLQCTTSLRFVLHCARETMGGGL